MIFGELRTSTNYNKDQKKIVGGKNGFGFKLVLIYSKWGEIETVDHIRKKKYTQRFEDNLTTICPPTINLHNPSEGCDLNYSPNSSTDKDLRYSLSNSFGFGGTNATLIFKKLD